MTNTVSYIFDSNRSPEDMGFQWNQAARRFIHRFNVWRLDYSENSSVYCELKLDPEDNTCELGIYEAPKTFYGPFYLDIFGIEEMNGHDIIFRRIDEKLKQLHLIPDVRRLRAIPEIHKMNYCGPQKEEVSDG